ELRTREVHDPQGVDQLERWLVICPAEKLVTITAQDFAVEQTMLETSGEPKFGGSRVCKAGTLPYFARECLRDEVRVHKIDPRAAQPVTVQHKNPRPLVSSMAAGHRRRCPVSTISISRPPQDEHRNRSRHSSTGSSAP